MPPAGRESELDALKAKYERLERRMERLRASAIELDSRLNRVENSLVFRMLRGIGRVWSETRGRAGQALLRSPFHRLYTRVTPPAADPYPAWIQAAEAAEPPLPPTGSSPLISVVIPVYKPRPEWLRAAIESVRNQTWPQWQLSVSLDGPDPAIEEEVRALASDDTRIRITVSPERGGISVALNAAATIATGDYVAFLDHDDLLTPQALGYIAAAFRDGGADAGYTDEDSIAPDGTRTRPNLKPDWSPELLLSCMYIGHLFVVSRAALDRAGWFRGEFDGAQDYDLALRLDENGARFRHVPRVLYHWRIHEESTAAAASAKPYAHEAGRRALAASLERRGEPFTAITDGPIAHTYRIQRPVPAGSGISIVIVSRTPALLGRCLDSLARTAGSARYQVIVVHHKPSRDDARMTALLQRFGCSVVPYTGAFNFSAMNNAAVRTAANDALLFLNDDVVALEPGWLETLLAHVVRPYIGIAGAKLVYSSGAIQHAGIAVGCGEGTIHYGRGTFRSDLWRWLELTRDVSAVTGACMAIRRELFLELGGFDERFPVNYNDVDLCLRARAAGYRVIVDPGVVLRHDEARTRASGTAFVERELFHERWHEAMNDPFYSPMLDRSGETIALGRR
jgi:GT2 family glycosyltransferase